MLQFHMSLGQKGFFEGFSNSTLSLGGGAGSLLKPRYMEDVTSSPQPVLTAWQPVSSPAMRLALAVGLAAGLAAGDTRGGQLTTALGFPGAHRNC